MAEFFVLASPLGEIDFAPATIELEIAQNVRCILTTRRGSVPLDRTFGLNFDWLDKPQNVARQMIETDIVITLAKYEPRVAVTRIGWERPESAADGALFPKVFMTKKEGA